MFRMRIKPSPDGLPYLQLGSMRRQGFEPCPLSDRQSHRATFRRLLWPCPAEKRSLESQVNSRRFRPRTYGSLGLRRVDLSGQGGCLRRTEALPRSDSRLFLALPLSFPGAPSRTLSGTLATLGALAETDRTSLCPASRCRLVGAGI